MGSPDDKPQRREAIPLGDDDEDTDPDRKTLYDQIQEAKDLKLLEIRQQLEDNNASYRIDDKTREYYDQLDQVERDKARVIKARENAALSKFKAKKQLLGDHASKVVKKAPIGSGSKLTMKRRPARPNLERSKSPEPTKVSPKPPATMPGHTHPPQSESGSAPVSLVQGYSDSESE